MPAEGLRDRRFAASLSRHPVPAHAVGEAAGDILEAFAGDDPDLLVCFLSPHFAGACDDIAHALAGILDPDVLLGMTAVSVVGESLEIEDAPALSMFAASLPGATLVPVSLRADPSEPGDVLGSVPDGAAGTLVLLADPFSVAVDRLLVRWAASHPGLSVIGGAASAARGPGGNRLLFGGTGPDAAAGPLVRTDGAVGVVINGVPVRTVVSQGCRPVGQPFVVTRGEGNRIEELGGRPALERLQECAAGASADDLELLRRGLHVGLRRRRAPRRVRAGRLPRSQRDRRRSRHRHARGGRRGRCRPDRAVPRPRRDRRRRGPPGAARRCRRRRRRAVVHLQRQRARVSSATPHHDAAVVDRLLGPIPAAGAFCAGEIGPVGGRNFLHGFTASLALFG